MKYKLLEILKSPNDKLICVDLDGTLCIGEAWTNEQCLTTTPKQDIIDKVNKMYTSGGHIIIYTARPETFRPETEYWLNKFGVRYHALVMATRKMPADLYIDDKCLNVEDLIINKQNNEN